SPFQPDSNTCSFLFDTYRNTPSPTETTALSPSSSTASLPVAHFTQQEMTDMATAIVLAMQQVGNINPAPALAPPPAPPPSSKITTAKPRKYTGGADYLDFKHKVYLYITANSRSFTVDADKILFVLSYLKGGHAATWAENYVDLQTVAGMMTLTATFNDFMMEFAQAFDDPN
ncbi:hypothetical protein EW145_g5673, partial [Phellinidium pouzarii]